MMTEATTARFNLDRFLQAQEPIYDTALMEIRQGAKRSHWMWFIFPQLAGLGSSVMAQRYAITSLDEALAYLAHPVFGARYRQCISALENIPHNNAETVFGPVDAMKLRSSLTLFEQASGEALFERALQRWFGGGDPATLRLLGRG